MLNFKSYNYPCGVSYVYVINIIYLHNKKKSGEKKQHRSPTMQREQHQGSKDGGICDMVVFVNFCTLFLGANTFVFPKSPFKWTYRCCVGG